MDTDRWIPDCPKCLDKGMDPPNMRAVSASGKIQPYCNDCSAQYQRERNQAQAIVMRGRENIDGVTTEELEWASEVLKPKLRGRPRGSNKCPRCQNAERAKGAPYCTKCNSEYRKERAAKRAQNASSHEADRLLIEKGARTRNQPEPPIQYAPPPTVDENPDYYKPPADMYDEDVEENETNSHRNLFKEPEGGFSLAQSLMPTKAEPEDDERPPGVSPSDWAAFQALRKRPGKRN